MLDDPVGMDIAVSAVADADDLADVDTRLMESVAPRKNEVTQIVGWSILHLALGFIICGNDVHDEYCDGVCSMNCVGLMVFRGLEVSLVPLKGFGRKS